MSVFQGAYRAHTNIALIKYWGKANKDLFIPTTSSLSLTLDALYTDTRVTFLSELDADVFYLNNQLGNEADTAKISKFLDMFRAEAGLDLRAKVESVNHVPTAAGLASSSSAFSALAAATRQALNLEDQISDQALSTFARRGSGSATRSIFGGFVEWQKGTSNENSMAVEIDDASWDVGMVIMAINTAEKRVSSREGMAHTVRTSPFYSEWVRQNMIDLERIKAAIAEQDFQLMGEIAEANAMRMHATTMASDPSFTYFEPDTIKAIQAVQDLRKTGVLAYYTIDAGPNVKVLCKASQMDEVEAFFAERFKDMNFIQTTAGPGIQRLDRWEYDDGAIL
ncbi:diphosphomevalonate decarboxylase [Aerococcus urinaeequi]|uniref:diphosphomevalonate decarboxylase n=1 Tax=Aerococcus urinaeequi TaxID=51665 RepID=UPI003D6B285D